MIYNVTAMASDVFYVPVGDKRTVAKLSLSFWHALVCKKKQWKAHGWTHVIALLFSPSLGPNTVVTFFTVSSALITEYGTHAIRDQKG